MGARKATKSKDPGRSPSVAGKNTTSAGKNVQPGSAKGGKAGKVGPAEKLKLEEENLAREQERLRRTKVDEFGFSLDDYNDILTCPVSDLSKICSRLFQYTRIANSHKSTFLDHLYVRTVYDLRNFSEKSEDTLRYSIDIFLDILKIVKKGPSQMSDILDVISEGFTELLLPPANLSPDRISQIMSLFTETIVYNSNLYRYVLTTETVPIYKTSDIKVLLPNENLLSSDGILPLAEAVPEKELVKNAPLSNATSNEIGKHPMVDGNVVDQVHHSALQEHVNEVVTLLNDAVANADHVLASSTGLSSLPVSHLTDADVQAAIQRVSRSKFAEFQHEVDEAVKRREKIIAQFIKK